MKDLINFLLDEAETGYTHTMRNVTTEALNCGNIFETYVNDGSNYKENMNNILNKNNGITRAIVDDIVVWSTKRGDEYHFGINTFQGEDMKCITFYEEPDIATDYGTGIAWKNSRGQLLAYGHRTAKGCKLIDLRDITLDSVYKPIGIVLDDTVDFNKYIVAFRKEDEIEDNDKYVTCTFRDNKMYILDSVNDIIFDYEGSNEGIYNIKPLTYDLFTYQRESDGNTCIFSKYYNTVLNSFTADFHILRALVKYPDTYDDSGIVILYKPIYNENDVIVNGDVHIAGLVSKKAEDVGKTTLLNKELTHIFKNVHGLDMFYSVMVKDEEDGLHTFVFFKMEDGKLTHKAVKASSIPGEIYVCKDTRCVTLEYNTNGYHQIASFWEDEMDLYKYSHIDIRLLPDVDADVVLTKFKEHIDSLNANKDMSDEEYFNLHYFNRMTKGNIVDGQQIMESDQYANITRDEIYSDIRRIYMCNNGKIQFRQRFDNTIEEFISVNVGKTEERQRLIKAMYEETISESNRLISEMENEMNNGVKITSNKKEENK